MKVCTGCNIPKEDNAFNKHRKHEHLQSICKKCAKDLGNRSRIRNRQFTKDYLSEHPCVDCGQTDIVVLEFDHVRGQKIKAVARMAQDAFSLESITNEIAKCDVRCANCHKKRHAKLKESPTPLHQYDTHSVVNS